MDCPTPQGRFLTELTSWAAELNWILFSCYISLNVKELRDMSGTSGFCQVMK
jgi:hypothetical protein